FNWLSETPPVKTKAIGDVKAPDYLNCCYFIETKLQRSELKKKLIAIEDQLGRIRNTGIIQPRSIDLDIVVWNEKVVDEDFYSRDFLRKAVLELLPELKY
ncbi:MAG: 2-amino-4-hydroxy-6-hydroxymethyldihydropteridine diphosphokinase, partial [Proteobacteria bacterium]|nr:2-amino-4-hydroxy-6-hydroxymethyldihydropteridine diphosphokinase [Pseudomonadota bacterium]